MRKFQSGKVKKKLHTTMLRYASTFYHWQNHIGRINCWSFAITLSSMWWSFILYVWYGRRPLFEMKTFAYECNQIITWQVDSCFPRRKKKYARCLIKINAISITAYSLSSSQSSFTYKLYIWFAYEMKTFNIIMYLIVFEEEENVEPLVRTIVYFPFA